MFHQSNLSNPSLTRQLLVISQKRKKTEKEKKTVGVGIQVKTTRLLISMIAKA